MQIPRRRGSAEGSSSPLPQRAREVDGLNRNFLHAELSPWRPWAFYLAVEGGANLLQECLAGLLYCPLEEVGHD